MSKSYSFKAWAIVNDESGRIMLNDVAPASAILRGIRMEQPAIYMTRKAALHHKGNDERLVRIVIAAAETVY